MSRVRSVTSAVFGKEKRATLSKDKKSTALPGAGAYKYEGAYDKISRPMKSGRFGK